MGQRQLMKKQGAFMPEMRMKAPSLFREKSFGCVSFPSVGDSGISPATLWAVLPRP